MVRDREKVFASRVIRTREENPALAVTRLPALAHQVSEHQEHRVVLDPVESFVRQPVAPFEFAADGIPLLARVAAFNGLDELEKALDVDSPKCRRYRVGSNCGQLSCACPVRGAMWSSVVGRAYPPQSRAADWPCRLRLEVDG